MPPGWVWFLAGFAIGAFPDRLYSFRNRYRCGRDMREAAKAAEHDFAGRRKR